MLVMSTAQSETSSMPSRASTMVRETIESGQTTAATPQSVSGPPSVPRNTPMLSAASSDFRDDTMPDEISQDNILTLEYGIDFQYKRTMSQTLLCRHSKIFPSYCSGASILLKKYRNCADIKARLTSLSGLVTAKKYEEDGVQDRVMKLLERIRDHYPLAHYQSRLNEVIEATVEDQFTLKNVKSQCKVKTGSKDFKDMVLMSKLRLLSHKGMMIVCDRLMGTFTRIEGSERTKAEKDRVTALAHGRVRLPGFQEQSVQSLVAWLEHGRLHCETDKQLYELYKLAVSLQVDALAEACCAQLYVTMSELIEAANSHGHSLQHLLAYSERDGLEHALHQYTPPDSAVKVIFHRVLHSAAPPADLSDLVSMLLAKYMDLELWQTIKLSVKHEFTLQIIGSMVAERQVKVEGDSEEANHVKREVHDGASNAQLKPTKTHQQPALVG